MGESLSENTSQFEMIDALERMVNHRHHAPGGHTKGAEIELREAHNALVALREAVRTNRAEPASFERVRHAVATLHLNETLHFADVLRQLEKTVTSSP
jgi:hypothetical protein